MIENSTSNFWQANFWGIVGSISGIASLIVSWFNFKYNTPRIEVEETHLIVPDWVIKDWKNKSVEQLKDSVLTFELEIIVTNKQGGSGSIDKPMLLIRIPNGKKLSFFTKYKFIKIRPITEHTESEKESENMFKIWTERHGRSFNLSGGEKLDDKLKYQTYKYPKNIFDYIKYYEQVKYYIKYRDNRGKKIRKEIKNIINKSDIEEDF